MSKFLESSISTFFSVPARAARAPLQVRKADSLPRRHSVKTIACAIQAAGLGWSYLPEKDETGERAVYMEEEIGCYHFGIAEHVIDGRVVGYMACDEFRNFRVSGYGRYLTLGRAVEELVAVVAKERQYAAEMDEADMTDQRSSAPAPLTDNGG
jgi:hypothetical protein